MQSPQSKDNLARRADRRILKESGACTAEGALLEKSGNTRDDGVRKRISFEIRGRALPSPVAPAMIGCPAQTATPRVIVKAKGVAASPAKRCSKNQRRKDQEVGPGSDISVCDYISKSNNKAPRPSVPCNKWYR